MHDNDCNMWVGHIKLALDCAFPGSYAKVGYPVQSNLPLAPTPVCLMIVGLNDSQTQPAIAQHCLAHEQCAFFTIPMSPDITNHICTLKCFTLNATEGHVIFALLWDQVMKSEDVMHFICTHNNAWEQRAYTNCCWHCKGHPNGNGSLWWSTSVTHCQQTISHVN